MSAVAAAAGAALDQVLGEPPTPWHPVARFGPFMEAVERRTYADARRAGVGHAAIGIGVATAVGVALRRAVGAPVATALATLVCVAGRMLDDEAIAVADLLDRGLLIDARVRVSSLVGRSTTGLDAQQVSRAVIESVAENCVDAATAPIFWAAIGGAPAVLAYRAVNTMDAMVGYRNERYERFGWAAARLDDLANYVPARLSVLAVAATRPRAAARVLAVVRRDSPQHPSPNGGVIEAGFAAALDIGLGGVNRYGHEVEDRGALGDRRPPEPADVMRAVRLRRDVTTALTAVLVVGSLARTRRAR